MKRLHFKEKNLFFSKWGKWNISGPKNAMELLWKTMEISSYAFEMQEVFVKTLKRAFKVLF